MNRTSLGPSTTVRLSVRDMVVMALYLIGQTAAIVIYAERRFGMLERTQAVQAEQIATLTKIVDRYDDRVSRKP